MSPAAFLRNGRLWLRPRAGGTLGAAGFPRRSEVRAVEPVRAGDALAGPVEGNPFDVIAVTGSLPDDEPVPALQEQLALGGRLFVVLGEPPVMEATLVTRVRSEDYRRETIFETSVQPLKNVPQPVRFVF